jgi:hypothetical protein
MPTTVLETASECDAVLSAATVTKISDRLDLKMNWLRIIDQNNYEKYKKDFAAHVPEYFDGDYHDFSEKRETLYTKEAYNQNLSTARDILMVSTPDSVINAWSQCMITRAPGLHCWVTNATEMSAILHIQWAPPAGLGNLSQTELQLQGGKVANDLFSVNENFIGEVQLLLTRDQVDQPIIGIASGQAGAAGNWSSNFFAPEKPKPPQPIEFDDIIHYGASGRVEYVTEAYKGPAKAEFTITVQSGNYRPGDPWMQLSVWLDGNLICWTDEEAMTSDPMQLSYLFTLGIPDGKQHRITIQHDNHNLDAQKMDLRVRGSYQPT